MKMANIRQMQTTEVRMICMVCGKTLLDKITNSIFREWALVEDMTNILEEIK